MFAGVRRPCKSLFVCSWLLIVMAFNAFGAPQSSISGYVEANGGTGVEGVSISCGNGGGSAVTAADGSYSVTVPNNWSGTVTASKAGWLISPASNTYSNVHGELANQNYTAYQPKISGRVASNTGGAIPNATVSASGGYSATSDSDGFYELILPYGWDGGITLSASGYSFDYTFYMGPVIADRANVNFTGFRPRISGDVKNASGFRLTNIVVTADNGGGSSSGNYYYEISVPYGWSGTVTASAPGYGFTAKHFTNVRDDIINQSFIGYQPKISGYVKKSDGTAISGTAITASAIATTTQTNASGYFEMIVPYESSDSIEPSKKAYSFAPTQYSWNNITADRSGIYFEGQCSGVTVRADGSGDYPTIQAAVDASVNGDIITLEAGTYAGPGNADIDFMGKAITVRGATDDANDCVIDCQADGNHPHRGFKFVRGENANSLLQCVKIINGYGPDEVLSNVYSQGGAIYCKNSSPRIKNCIMMNNNATGGGGLANYYSNTILDGCVIINNSASSIGAGIYNYYSNPTIINTTIGGNSGAWQGGGMQNFHSSPTISNCIISGNQAQSAGGGIENEYSSPAITDCVITGNSTVVFYGGGLFNNWDSNPVITRCRISSNIAAAGAGMTNYMNCRPTIKECIISDNNAPQGGTGAILNYTNCYPVLKNCTIVNNYSFHGEGISTISGGQATLSNCIVWGNQETQIYGNTVITYSDIQGGYTGKGNINVDPLLSDDSGLTMNSPCINAGDANYIPEPNEKDIDGEARVAGTRIDMGADEVQGVPILKISGYVKDTSGAALSGVAITATNGGGSTASDASGYYELTEVYNWSGTITAALSGYSFAESPRSYSNIRTDQNNADFTGTFTRVKKVNPDGTGTYATIQSAIDAAEAGDEVVLEAGTYTGEGNRDIDFKGKAITVRSASGEPNTCIIDCQGSSSNPHRGFKFVSQEGAGSVLENVSIINGYGPQELLMDPSVYSSAGGAIYCYRASPTFNNLIIRGNFARYGAGIINFYYSSPKISNCTFTNNSAEYYGGAICNHRYSNAAIRRCLIENNTSSSNAGAIYNHYYSKPTIDYCIIRGNSANQAAIYNHYYATATIRNSVIMGNSASYGFAGIWNDQYCGVTVKSCTIVNNSAPYGPSAVLNSGSTASAYIENSIIRGNAPSELSPQGFTVKYSNIEGGYAGTANTDVDPLFESDGYHLSTGSPCIDAGNPAYVPEQNETDIDGGIRIYKTIDIGADEICGSGGTSPLIVTLPGTMLFQTQGVSSVPQSQNLSIRNYGSGLMNWHIEIPSNCNWLSAVPLSGQTGSGQDCNVQVTVDPNNMGYGVRTCQLQVIDENAENSPAIVIVNLEVIGPRIALGNSQYTFTAYGKSDPAIMPQQFTITNTGYDRLNWQIEVPQNCGWLIASPTSGEADIGQNNMVTLSVDASRALYGTNTVQFNVTSPDATNSPQTVKIDLTVSGPRLQISQIVNIYAEKDSNGVEGTFTIQNTGYDTMNWSVEAPNDCNWISAISPMSGQCGRYDISAITIKTNTTGLEVGRYDKPIVIHAFKDDYSAQATLYVGLQVYASSVIHVPADYNTIQEAINAAQVGNKIIVHPGKYAGFSTNERLVTIQSIEPENPAVVAATIIESPGHIIGQYAGGKTVINGLSFIYNPMRPQDYYYKRGVDVLQGDATIKNCVIRNFPDGGICASARQSNSSTKIINCLITHNGYSYDYYGYPPYYGSPSAGICIEGLAMVEISNCLITNNYCGGITLGTKSNLSAQLTNCTIADNGSNYPSLLASGIVIGDFADVTIKNAIIDSDVNIPQIEISQYAQAVSLDVDHSLIKGGREGISAPNTVSINWGQGNIDSDPCFARAAILDDNDTPDHRDDHWIEGDYHLKSHFGRWQPSEFINMDASGNGLMDIADFAVLAGEWQMAAKPILVTPATSYIYYHPYLRADLDRNGVVDCNDLMLFCGNYADYYDYGKWVYDDVNSPCIDAGDQNSDWKKELWPHGRRVNMGVFGNTFQASMSADGWGNPVDLNNDGLINLIDYAQLAGNLNRPSCPSAGDINRDGLVDMLDLCNLCENWLWIKGI
jgi:hypothetical protein